MTKVDISPQRLRDQRFDKYWYGFWFFLGFPGLLVLLVRQVYR